MTAICEQFPGRLRDLCEGRGRDGRTDPPRFASDQFRVSYGLAPLSDDPAERARQLNEEGEIVFPALDFVQEPPPLDGPGHELELIFDQLEIPYREACGCAAYARQMDLWGVAGCREHFDEIIERLRKHAAEYSLWQQLAAAGKAIASGLAFQLNPLDPFPGLVNEAIRRADTKQTQISRQAVPA